MPIWRDPAYNPVMIDRGLISDEQTTRKIFLHAIWILALCIMAFSMFGVPAAWDGTAYQAELTCAWSQILPGWVFGALMISLRVSALSTLDSALSPAARHSVLCVFIT